MRLFSIFICAFFYFSLEVSALPEGPAIVNDFTYSVSNDNGEYLLTIENNKNGSSVSLPVGSRVTLWSKGRKGSGKITKIEKDYIVVDDTVVYLDEIERLRTNTKVGSAAKVLLLILALLFILSGIASGLLTLIFLLLSGGIIAEFFPLVVLTIIFFLLGAGSFFTGIFAFRSTYIFGKDWDLKIRWLERFGEKK